MRRRFYKTIGFFMAVMMLFCQITSINAYAKEEDVQPAETEASVQSVSGYAYDQVLSYGQASYVCTGEAFRNKENLAVLRLNGDARTHRVILKVAFEKQTSRTQNHSSQWVEADNGIGDVKLALYVSINGGVAQKFYRNAYDTQPWQFEISNVPSGATIEIIAEAFTADGYTSNGNYRSIMIKYLEAYFD